MKKLLPLLNALFFLLVTTGQSAVSSLPEDKITTQLGDLQVFHEGKKRYVEWNGKIIYKMPPKYRSLSFVKHFTNVKPAEIILINEHEGGSGCAGRYRLIALKQDGSYEVTKALGNCTEARVKEQGPKIILYFPAFVNAPSQTWIYEKFSLRKTAERKSRAPGFWMFAHEEHEDFIKFIIWDKAREDNESYEVWFVVTSPAGKEYKAKKKISGSYNGDVIFPDSFNIRLDELEPGLYLCKYLVNEETLAECRFHYDTPKGTKGFKVVDLLSEGDLWEERFQELKKE